MSSGSKSNSQGNQSSGTGGSSSFTPYEVTSRGTNDAGNSYDTRTQPGGSAYHYSNSDKSYYYSNSDGSKYYNSGSGDAKYTAPDGQVYKK